MTEGLTLTVKKTYEIFLTPLLRNGCFFGISPVSQHRGEGGNTSHPPLCFVVKQNIGEVARNDGGVNSFRILEIPADA